MSPREEYFENFELKKGELVPFNNNKAYKFHGIGKVRHKLFGDHELLLYDVRYHLACYKVKWEIIQSQRYDYVDLICYAFNLDERLQDSISKMVEKDE